MQMYHSLHAQGVNIQEFLKQQEEKQDEDSTMEAAKISLKDENLVKDEGAAPDAIEIEETNAVLDDQPTSTAANTEGETTSMPGPATQMPQFLMGGSTQSDGLKNLMMSWYWAGYYTGLHEGRQQGQSSSSDQKAADGGGA